MRSFVLGIVTGAVALAVGVYLFIVLGGVPLGATAAPLPLEVTLAHAALRANIGAARNTANPLPIDDSTLTAGAKVYHENCAMCHGEPDGEISALAKGMSPDPPQLFNPGEMVTDDPMGVTYWKVTHGIRLSGMPAFGDTLSETERWQVTALVAHADKLPEAVRAAFTSTEPPEKRPEKPVGSAGEERRPTSPRRQ